MPSMFTYAHDSQPGQGIKELATYRTPCQPREMTSKERFHIADCLLGLLPQGPFTFSIFVAVNVAGAAEGSFELEKLEPLTSLCWRAMWKVPVR